MTQSLLPRAPACGGDRGCRLIRPNHRAGLAHEFCDEKRDVARPAADVQHAHAGAHAAVAKEQPRGRLDQQRLSAQAL